MGSETQYSITPALQRQFSLCACRFHVGKFGNCEIQLEPAIATVFTAEEIAVPLRGVHAIGIRRIEGKTLNKTLVGLRNRTIKLLPAFAAVGGLNKKRFGAGVALAPLTGLAVSHGRIEH